MQFITFLSATCSLGRSEKVSCSECLSNLCKTALTTLTLVCTTLTLDPCAAASAKGVLSTNNLFRRYIVTDSAAILRYAIPLPSERTGLGPPAVRSVQQLLERLSIDLRTRGTAGIVSARRDLLKLNELLSQEQLDILLDVPAKRRQDAAQLLAELERTIAQMEAELGIQLGFGSSGIFPPQLVALQSVIKDAVASNNSTQLQYDRKFSSIRICAVGFG